MSSEAEARPGSRLAVDDPNFCKWCGKDISDLRTIVNDGLGEVTHCGSCAANKMILKANATKCAKENHDEDVHPDEIDDPPQGWDLSTELWYQWSAEVMAQYRSVETEQETGQ